MFTRHEEPHTFTALNIVIIGLEVLAAVSLIFGLIGALYMMFTAGESVTRDYLTTFISVGFGGLALSFILLGMAEFLILLLKIEYNTRR